MMKMLITILVAIVCFASCDRSEDEIKVSPADNRYDLKFKIESGFNYNDTLYLNFHTCIQDDNLSRICFETVVSDSRCPEDVVCVWEGEATARFIISVFNNNPVSVDLKVGTNDTLVCGLKISFVSLLPYPNTGSPHDMEDYKAGLVIRRP